MDVREFLPGVRAPNPLNPFCRSIRAQGRPLPSKPCHHLIPACSCVQGALGTVLVMEYRAGSRHSCPDPHRKQHKHLQPRTAGQSSAELCSSTPAFGNPPHCKLLQPQQSPPAEIMCWKICLLQICSLSLLKMQYINSNDCKGPAFPIGIIHFQSKLPDVQLALSLQCHCTLADPGEPQKRKVSGKLPGTYPSLHGTEK